jgi:hypothetical protein
MIFFWGGNWRVHTTFVCLGIKKKLVLGFLFLFFGGRASERRREKTKDGMRHISFIFYFILFFVAMLMDKSWKGE